MTYFLHTHLQEQWLSIQDWSNRQLSIKEKQTLLNHFQQYNIKQKSTTHINQELDTIMTTIQQQLPTSPSQADLLALCNFLKV